MECGIVGLPGSGMTSLFRALAGASIHHAPAVGKPHGILIPRPLPMTVGATMFDEFTHDGELVIQSINHASRSLWKRFGTTRRTSNSPTYTSADAIMAVRLTVLRS